MNQQYVINKQEFINNTGTTVMLTCASKYSTLALKPRKDVADLASTPQQS